ncbi:MAG TPA: FAD-dependent oxidoreductase [Mycobacteriales bacterium]|nr:FAD-dependent oxidoreductase [Mycobacteriales bacterium]
MVSRLGGIDRVVVVGAGLAGARTCQELRSGGYRGELVLVGAEPHPPYDRPPLSKAVLLGEQAGSPLDPDWYVGAEARFGVTATGLEPGLLCTTAGDLPWDALVLATGAVPRRLPGDGAALVLRTLDDAARLHAAFAPGVNVIVVGAGWIGAEVVTAARRHGAAVTVLEAAATPLVVALGPEVGGYAAPWYAEAGAVLRTGVAVSTVDGSGVTLADGEYLPADVVVEGIGVRPELGWLVGSGVDVDPASGGVLVDEHCRASLPGVYAVGDCAARWSPRLGRRVRTEHWDDALRAPKVAAAVLLGDADAAYDPVPYIWSEQFGRFLQWAGWRDGPPAVWRGDPTGRSWAAGWLDAAGRLTGFLSVDRPRDVVQARRAIDAGRPMDPGLLADPAVAVRDAVAEPGVQVGDA